MDSNTIDKIQSLCHESGIEVYKVLPRVKDYYSGLRPNQYHHREVIDTARDIIHELTGKNERNVATTLNEREKNITFNRNTADKG